MKMKMLMTMIRPAAATIRTRRRHCRRHAKTASSSVLFLLGLMLLMMMMMIEPVHSFSVTTSSPPNSCSRAFGGAATIIRRHRLSPFSDKNAKDIDDDDDDDDDWNDYEKELPEYSSSSLPDSSLSWKTPALPDDDNDIKLGINIGSMLSPLTEKEASELKAAATEIINDAIAGGIDEIEALRRKMTAEIQAKKRAAELASELETKKQSERLLNKIDALTETFLSDTQRSRAATKRAAAADQANEGKGVEVGVWGNDLDGNAVTTTTGGLSTGGSLLGSIDAARAAVVAAKNTKSNSKSGIGGSIGIEDAADAATTDSTSSTTTPASPPIIAIVADTQQDAHAKLLLPRLTQELEQALPGLQINLYKPTSTLPLGGDNAACAILFATSLSDKSSVYNALDRLLRKTLNASTGQVGRPPTQIVLVSTVGTARTNQMPYSLQNAVNGGKLEKRKQMEEALVRIVQDRISEPPLDYTIVKLGSELKTSGLSFQKEPFQLLPGDCLDGALDINAAAIIMKEAIAFQPTARNATLCCVGTMSNAQQSQEALDDEFLRVSGPEVLRRQVRVVSDNDDVLLFDQLAEYLRGWADLLAESKKGLTTPIRVQDSILPANRLLPTGVTRQDGVQLLFLPTATGKNYLSRTEEKALESERRGGGGGSSSSSSSSSSNRSRAAMFQKKEGGIEVVLELFNGNTLRVRAKRCNYAEQDAVIKELSEQTILKRLEEALNAWIKEHDK